MQNTIGRNDQCWCGSGKKYKHCHLELDTTPPENRVDVSLRKYSKDWSSSATNLSAQGCYDWAAKLLSQFNVKRILDIGCGDGTGLVALLNNVDTNIEDLISIDENYACIELAKIKLEHVEKLPTIIRRMEVKQVAPNKYLSSVAVGNLTNLRGIAIIEADILVDDEDLLTYLLETEKFDAITVWFIGTHQLKHQCANIARLCIASPGEYRLRVQNKIYELADKILRPGGVLQIVDRGEVPETKELVDDFLNSHRDQASVTDIQVQSLDYLEYSEIKSGKIVPLITTKGTSGREPSNGKIAAISIISKKPE